MVRNKYIIKKSQQPCNWEGKEVFWLQALLFTHFLSFPLKLDWKLFVGLKRKLPIPTSFLSHFLSLFQSNQTVENPYFLSTFLFSPLFLPLLPPNKQTLNFHHIYNVTLP